MSHTTKIDNIVITDLAALRQTIAELKTNGIKCDLLENAVPRAYYPNQEGLGQAPFVVQLTDARYDVGLYQTEDGKGYTARADLFAGDVARVLGAEVGSGESREQASLGKLYQTYAVNAATRKAVQQGYRVTRSTQANGTIQLRVAV